jgi:chloramphenicol 3-O phosphotransferase
MQGIQLIVVEGGSGTGKSSLARSLQESLQPQQWLHFSFDTLLYCLPPSVLDMANQRNDWSAVDKNAITRSVYGCLCTLLDHGHRVIFDCVLMTERGARELLTALQSHTPVLVRLTCSWDEIERRTIARGDRTIEEARRGFETSGLFLNVDYEIDTTHRSSAEIAESLVPLIAGSSSHDAWQRSLARLNSGSASTDL